MARPGRSRRQRVLPPAQAPSGVLISAAGVLVRLGQEGEERADPEPFLGRVPEQAVAVDGVPGAPPGAAAGEVAGGVQVVAAPEEIDITNAPDLRSALQAAGADGHRTLVLDMSRTRFCDSAGIHTLLAMHKRAQSEGGELLLVMPDPPVLRIFAITG